MHDVTHTVPACVWPQPPVRQIRLIIGTGVFQQVHSVLSRCQMWWSDKCLTAAFPPRKPACHYVSVGWISRHRHHEIVYSQPPAGEDVGGSWRPAKMGQRSPVSAHLCGIQCGTWKCLTVQNHGGGKLLESGASSHNGHMTQTSHWSMTPGHYVLCLQIKHYNVRVSSTKWNALILILQIVCVLQGQCAGFRGFQGWWLQITH